MCSYGVYFRLIKLTFLTLFFNSYHKYKQSRKVIKDLINANNITEAKNRINSIIPEHDNYISSKNIPNDGNNFTSIDNLSLHHAQRHLTAFEQTDSQTQKDATIRALDET